MDLLRQLQALSNQIGSFARQIEPLLALIAIAAGAAVCFAGARFAKAVLAAMGFVAGAGLAAIITLLITSGNTDAVLIPAILGGLIGMALCLAVYYTGLILSGLLVGAFAALTLSALANGGPNLVVMIALALLGGWIFLAAQKSALTVMTALGGAWALVSGVSVLAGGDALNVVGYVREPSLLGFDTTVLFVSWLAVSVAGAIVQAGRVPGLPLQMPGAKLQPLLVTGAAIVTCGALFLIALSARAFPTPAIPPPTRAGLPGGTPRATLASGTPGATLDALSAIATAMAASTATEQATPAGPTATATRTPVPSPTRDPASYAFGADGAPTVDHTRKCIGGYYIYGVVRDRVGQALSGVRIKYGTATVFPPVAVTEAKGYELTVGATDSEWYVRVVDENHVEMSPVVIVRTAGLNNGDCWYRLDWRKNR